MNQYNTTGDLHRWPGSPAPNTWQRPGANRGTDRKIGTLAAREPVDLDQNSLTFNRLIESCRAGISSRFAAGLRRRKVGTGDYLVHQDEWVDTVFFPETAVLSEFHLLNDGRTVEVALTGNESAVGLASVFGQKNATNGAQVCIGGTVIAVCRELLEAEVARDNELKQAFIGALLERTEQLSLKVTCNSFHSVEQRFCNWLLTLCVLSERNSLPVTHEQIARALGVHRPSVTFIAQSLREKNLINYTRGRIAVKNIAGLSRLACDCGSAEPRFRDVQPVDQAYSRQASFL